ncbi:AAA family ATPase (plasmid) [Streptomyces sp. NBC_00873]|uniref:AAA family ATPase n=1 Tax=unclassified Streptomyces TaxID=2593676 RepID=UPI0038665F74|nr:AAA family ATPase [Streptomyces sp. NBC_00873]WTA49184.1 AAA family ATPase [Streptomyces sp. NBC_00842]
MTTTPPIRIGVLGAHSTGKTMLLKRIEMELRGNGVNPARTGSIGKRAALNGLPKMQKHTAASTEWIIAQGIADEIAAGAQGADVILADRAPHDALAYLNAALEFRGEQIHHLERDRLLLLASTQLPKYDLLLATVLDETMPVEQKHDYDPRYRVLVNQHVHALLTAETIPHLRVTSDPGSQANAVAKALEICLQEAAV